MKEFRIAFPKTVPIMAAYLFLGISYGILMTTSGFPFWLPVLTALSVYTGSLEFLLTDILLSAYNPVATLITALMIGSRHIFYGIAMLPKYRGTGKAKFYLIYTCSDETFAVNYSAHIPAGLDKARFYTSVSLLDQMYWVSGSAIGGLCGSLITFNTTGLAFIMTAMFVTIFMNQWLSDADKAVAPGFSNWLRTHGSELIGVAGALICLVIFGPDRFIIPTLILVLILLTVFRRQLDTPPESAENRSSASSGDKKTQKRGEDRS